MRISQKGLDVIMHFESLHDGDLTKIGLQPKKDPAGIWTVGYGHALQDTDKSWLKGDTGHQKIYKIYPQYLNMTEAQADALLISDLSYYEPRINGLNLDLSQQEFDAILSFSYNVGVTAFKKSTLCRRIKNREGDIKEAFLMWTKAGGVILPGLTRRRNTEATLFLTGNLAFA